MRINLVSGPATEPITLDEAKLHCQITISDTDAYVSSLISASREYVEAITGIIMVSQTWDLFLDAWDQVIPSSWYSFYGGSAGVTTVYNNAFRQSIIYLPHTPIASITWVKYIDQNGDLQTWDSANYDTSLGSNGRVAPKQNQYFPATASCIDAVNVRYVAGNTIPARAKHAVKMMVYNLYDNRIAASEVPTKANELGFDALVNSLGNGRNLFA
jgi:hypothetical protein